MPLLRVYHLVHRVESRFRLCLLRVVYGPRLKVGRSVGIRRGFIVNISVADAKLTIGNNCSFNNSCSLNVRESISIGNDCILGEGVRFYDHDHLFESRTSAIREQGFVCEAIVVEQNCWLGSNVTVLKGVTVGANSIVGAGVILTKSIPPNSVVVAKQSIAIRTRTESSEELRDGK